MADLTTQLAKFLEQLYRGTVGGTGNGVTAWTFNAGTSIVEVSDGILRLANAAGTDFTRLVFGENSSADFAIGKSAAALNAFLGDGSGYAPFNAGQLSASQSTAVPAGGSASAVLSLSTTAGLGIYFGSGVPTVSAAQGSVYIRTDGSSTTTRLYVNSSAGSGTTWTNVATAA